MSFDKNIHTRLLRVKSVYHAGQSHSKDRVSKSATYSYNSVNKRLVCYHFLTDPMLYRCLC